VAIEARSLPHNAGACLCDTSPYLRGLPGLTAYTPPPGARCTDCITPANQCRLHTAITRRAARGSRAAAAAAAAALLLVLGGVVQFIDPSSG